MLQNFPEGRTPILSAPVTMVTQPLQFTSAALRNTGAPSGTAVPQPYGPILGGQDERLRQVSFSGGFLYSCETSILRHSFTVHPLRWLCNHQQSYSNAPCITDPWKLGAGLNTPVNISSRIYNGLAYFIVAPNFTSDGNYTARIIDQG